MTRLGADATATTIADLKALGVTFVSRYVSDFPWKNLSLAEAQRLSAAGLDVVTNWENDVNDWAGGRPQGVAYAERALAQHKACGGPTDPAGAWGIYFSVDEKVDPDSVTLHDYFRGINSVLGVAHTGAYAQTSVLRVLRAGGLIGCGERGGTWRSMSTFNLPEGLGLPGEFDVEQTGQYNPTYDRDIANSARFGQWRIGVDDMAALDDNDLNNIAARVENRSIGAIAKPNPAPATTSAGVELASLPARFAQVNAKLDALSVSVGGLKAGGVDLAALEALIESHLSAGSVPGVIAAAVLNHLSAATAGAKP